MEKHVTLVASLYIALGVIGVLGGIIVFIAVAGGGVLSGDSQAIMITSSVATVISLIIFTVSVPSIIGGVGLFKHAPWAKILVIILSVINLFNLPIGTVIGVYSLWVLLNDETARIFMPKTTQGI